MTNISDSIIMPAMGGDLGGCFVPECLPPPLDRLPGVGMVWRVGIRFPWVYSACLLTPTNSGKRQGQITCTFPSQAGTGRLPSVNPPQPGRRRNHSTQTPPPHIVLIIIIIYFCFYFGVTEHVSMGFGWMDIVVHETCGQWMHVPFFPWAARFLLIGG